MIPLLLSAALAFPVNTSWSADIYALNPDACLASRGLTVAMEPGAYRLDGDSHEYWAYWSAWTSGPVTGCVDGTCTNGYRQHYEVHVDGVFLGEMSSAAQYPTQSEAGPVTVPNPVVCLTTPGTARIHLGDTDCSDNIGFQKVILHRLDDDCSSALCFGDVSTGDTDGDGLCDDVDPCSTLGPDSDGDGVSDACDVCMGNDHAGDLDSDGVCDDLDLCPGDDTVDTDGDGVPDACDPCEGDQAFGDTDGDGVCDDRDLVGVGLDLTAATCPGRTDLFLTGVTPGERVVLAASVSPGDLEVPVGPCAGLQSHLGPGAASVATWRANAAGEVVVTDVALRQAACGMALQAFEVSQSTGCRASNPVRVPAP